MSLIIVGKCFKIYSCTCWQICHRQTKESCIVPCSCFRYFVSMYISIKSFYSTPIYSTLDNVTRACRQYCTSQYRCSRRYSRIVYSSKCWTTCHICRHKTPCRRSGKSCKTITRYILKCTAINLYIVSRIIF